MIAEKGQEKTHDRAGERAHDKASEKAHEKVMEKRKALGRGLESLLPRPRAVTAIAEPVASQSPRHMDGAAEGGDGRASTPVAPSFVPPSFVAPSFVSPSPATTRSSGPASPVTPSTGDQPSVAQPAAGMAIAGAPAAPLSAASGQTFSSQASAVQTETERAGVPVVPSGSELAGTSVPSISPGATVAELMASGEREEVMELPLHLIDRNPHQTRTRFREEPLNELAESIKVHGVLQPIVVRPAKEGRYFLILGERRMRGANIAGLETIPAIVKRVSEQQAAEMTLVENLQRQDLNCVEQAWAFSRMSQEFKLTQEQIGARVGMSREAVSNYMRLLTLPEGVHEMLIMGKLSFSHARALLKLNTSAQGVLWAYAKKALDEKMSVAKLEELVAGLPRVPKAPGQGGARWVDPNVKAAQRKLEEILGMRVRIRDQAGRGKIQIEYATIEDFDRVMEMLGGK